VTWNYCEGAVGAACADGLGAQAAGGGGLSRYFVKPTWQPLVWHWLSAGNPCGLDCRQVPDISANAGVPEVIYTNGAWAGVDGTSAAAPLIAGLVADKNQACMALTGDFAPSLYALANPSVYGSALTDITSGDNDMTRTYSGADFPASAGYDVATGLGSPLAAGLTCPEVSSVVPSSSAPGTNVTVYGLGLERASISFGGAVASVVAASATQATVVVPSGSGQVVVGGSSVLGAGTTTAGFTILSPPPPFAPHNVGAPQVAVTPDGSQQIVFWKDTTINQLAEAWYALGAWHGPVGFPQLGTLTSTPAVAVAKDGSQQLVFWQGPGGHLFEAWYALAAWHGPVDITNGSLGGHAILGSAPSVVTTKDGSELVFWRGTDGHLGEAWYAAGGWHGPADFTSLGSLASSPSATITPDGSQQLVFFQGADNRLTEDWYALGSWHGPMELGALSSPPSVTVTPDGSTQLVFSKTAAGHLQESWYTLGSWHGPIDWTTSAFGGNGLLTSSPSATVTVDGSTQIVFWQGAGSTLWEGWYTLGAWHGPVDFSAG
jgi:hypothetical protein